MSDADRYLAFNVLARNIGQDRDAVQVAIQRALGCTDEEDDCPMLTCSSSGGTMEEMMRWSSQPAGPGTYYDGCRAALRWHAVHRDGEQWVGMGRRTLKQALAEVDEAERKGDPYGPT